MSWIDNEPGWKEARREIARAARGGRRRWIRTLGIALFVTLAILAWRARRERSFDASIVIRVTEESLDEEATPPTPMELARYLSDVSLSRPTLFEVIEQHSLYPDKIGIDKNLALDQMRDDIEVSVVQNYFAPEQFMENPVRSARIVLTYSGREPDQALVVARELGKRIADEQTRVRRQLAQSNAASAERTLAGLRDELLELRREQARLNLLADKSSLEVVQLARIVQQIADLEQELQQRMQGTTELELQRDYEGLRFEIVDPGAPPQVLLGRWAELALVWIFSFVLALPVVGISVGTLDRKIHDLEGVRRLGLEAWGHIPHPAEGTRERS
ncbi:MAG TPA: hypothetical protein VFB62_28045 [Polyangiaceae bacterium]|jgi:hypothetical protein|nr:hypothetical protein [Polyangiaceae bacterium]